MAKDMAIVAGGKVVNIGRFSDSYAETETIKDLNGKDVIIGDDYHDGKFYRDGEILLSESEKLSAVTADRDNLLDDIAALIEEVYNMDSEMIGE